MSGKRNIVVVALAVVAIVGAVIFLLKEAKKSASETSVPRTAVKKESSSTTTPSADRPELTAEPPAEKERGKLQGSSAPLVGEGKVKSNAEGREYVEYFREDGTRVRDFRKSARNLVGVEGRRSDKKPRLLEVQNAARLKRNARPAVWECMRSHWDELTSLPGVGASPSVVVFADTRVADGKVTVGGVRSVMDAQANSEALARCIEGALRGLEAELDPSVDQKAYEHFELGMRFRLPAIPQPKRRP